MPFNDTPNPNFLSQFAPSSESSEFYSPMPEGYTVGKTKFVVVLGTVMSGLGKGIFSSSLAKLLKDKGMSVAPCKLEGYLNIDSGTLNPFRHGEVFVLDDGTECDMDLGTYERILDQDLKANNFTTAGQIYTTILERERKGGFLGRDVQMIPHVTGEVKRRLRDLSMQPNGTQSDVVFVEVGGTVGDYENGFYIEALRELAFEEGANSTCFVALTYIVEPEALGEQKSKPAQLGIKRLMETGIQPHLVACRASSPVSKIVKQKIAMFSNVPEPRVFSMHDRKSVYEVPDAMREEGLDREVLSILELHGRVNSGSEDRARKEWNSFTNQMRAPKKCDISIGVLGKYTGIPDAYASIEKALEHAGTQLSCKVNIKWIDVSDVTQSNAFSVLNSHGINGAIVPGGFGERGFEGKISCIQVLRESKIPFLGICFGFQAAVIEYARNKLNWKNAGTTELNESADPPVISELPDQKEIENLGGTMRLGGQSLRTSPDSLAEIWYENSSIRERFRHRFEVDPRYIKDLEKAGLCFSGKHPKHPIMQILELSKSNHPYFVAAQFHPELTSRPLSPHPMFIGLVDAAMNLHLQKSDHVKNSLKGKKSTQQKTTAI